MIGVGWMIAQNLEGTKYPIVFESITFNKVESWSCMEFFVLSKLNVTGYIISISD